MFLFTQSIRTEAGPLSWPPQTPPLPPLAARVRGPEGGGPEEGKPEASGGTRDPQGLAQGWASPHVGPGEMVRTAGCGLPTGHVAGDHSRQSGRQWQGWCPRVRQLRDYSPTSLASSRPGHWPRPLSPGSPRTLTAQLGRQAWQATAAGRALSVFGSQTQPLCRPGRHRYEMTQT